MATKILVWLFIVLLAQISIVLSGNQLFPLRTKTGLMKKMGLPKPLGLQADGPTLADLWLLDQTIAYYAFVYDIVRDAGEWTNLFTPDDVSPPVIYWNDELKAKGREDIFSWINTTFVPGILTKHIQTNVLFDFEGDITTMFCELFFTATYENETAPFRTESGYYFRDYVMLNNSWFISGQYYYD